MKIRVAVLDNDPFVRDEFLVRGLSERGFDAEGFALAGELYQRMLAVSFELLVLDVDIENGAGLQVASYLRGISPIGIVTLAAGASREERVRALMEAVDVWLGKPVDLDVLAATLHSLSRRVRYQSDFAQTPNVSAGWSLSPGNWRLIAPDQRSMPLNLLERHLLIRLLASAGELVAHADLIEALAVVGGAFDRHRLEIVVHRLRRKVQQHFGRALPLRSIRGSGYVLAPDERGSEPAAPM